MADKNSVDDWDTDPVNNTDIGGTNIAEGCAPGGVNDAIRKVMAQVKEKFDEVDAALVAAAPVGLKANFAMSTPPTGWLKRNGAAVSRTTYAALFAAIGTTYGAGNGTTTFNLPDDRGYFERAWDDGRGIDAGRAFGSYQNDAFASHNHTASATSDSHTHTITVNSGGAHTHTGTAASAGSHTHTGTAASAGAHTHTAPSGRAFDGVSGSRFAETQDGSTTNTTNSAGAHTHTLSISSGGAHTHSVSVASGGAHTHTASASSDSHTHTITVNAAGGTETRPKNAVSLACIKY